MIWTIVLTVAATSIVAFILQTTRIAIIQAIRSNGEAIMASNQEQLNELQTVLTAVVAQQGTALADLDAKLSKLEADGTADFGPVRALVDQLKAGVQTLDNYTPTVIEAEDGEDTPPEETPGTPAEPLPGEPETDLGDESNEAEDGDSETVQP